MATKNGSTQKFKQALDQQNKSERGRSGSAKRQRDAAEGEAAQHGLGALEKHSKGRPKQGSTQQKATAKKSPQAARSQSR
jgi:hypothetical protein